MIERIEAGQRRRVIIVNPAFVYTDFDSGAFYAVDRDHTIEAEQEYGPHGWKHVRYFVATIEEIPHWWERLMFWRKAKLPAATVVQK